MKNSPAPRSPSGWRSRSRCPAAAQDKIRIGTEAAYKPFAWVLPSGELTGFDIDIAKALCAADGRRVRDHQPGVRRPDPGAERQEDRRDHRLDDDHADRLKAIDFAGPYYTVPALFIAPKDSGVEISEEGLDGKYVGVQRGSTMANYIKAKFPGARIQLYDTSDAANLDLASGRVDVVFADSVVLQRVPRDARGRQLRHGRRAGRRPGDPRHRRRHRRPQGRHGAEGEVRRGAAAIIASGEYKTINDTYIPVSILPQ